MVAKVLLCYALFTDILAEAKNFILLTQSSNISIINIPEAVEGTNIPTKYMKVCKEVSRICG